MIVHAPWSPDLGISRVAIDLAEELGRLGWEVDHFDRTAAFPRPGLVERFFGWTLFPARAARHLRRTGGRYDAVLAEHGDLPQPRRRLGFDGLLCARTNGLAHFYLAEERRILAEERRRGIRRGTLGGNLLRALARRLDGGERRIEASMREADLLFVLNRDELQFVTDRLGLGGKTVLLANGLSRFRRAAFAAARPAPEERLASQTVVFVGHWGPRKGASDFPRLVRSVREGIPNTRFRLLGTGAGFDEVTAGFDERDRAATEVLPRYEPDRLPELLREAAVGVLPSRVEGFPLGVLELLAAGIPTAAYDAPGARELLLRCAEPLLAPPGDPDALAALVRRGLSLSPEEYARRSEEAAAVAGEFRAEDVAAVVDRALREGIARRRAPAE